MPGPDYTIFAITDLAMCTTQHNGDMSFLSPFANGSKLVSRGEDNTNEEREVDPSYGFDDFLASMDILLCGRHTYNQIMHYSRGQWPYPKKRLIVFSETPLTESTPHLELGGDSEASDYNQYPPPQGAEQFSGSPSQLVQKLSKEGTKSRKFKRESVWIMGGSTLRGTMLQLGVVERVEIVMVPRIMKDGVPLWTFGDSPNEEDFHMALIDCRSYENGVVSLSYSVGESEL